MKLPLLRYRECNHSRYILRKGLQRIARKCLYGPNSIRCNVDIVNFPRPHKCACSLRVYNLRGIQCILTSCSETAYEAQIAVNVVFIFDYALVYKRSKQGVLQEWHQIRYPSPYDKFFLQSDRRSLHKIVIVFT